MIAKIVDFRGTIEFDASMPDGTLRKLLSIDLAKKCGWTPKINLEEGLVQTISWFNLNRTGLRS